jgi:hypothetical protein
MVVLSNARLRWLAPEQRAHEPSGARARKPDDVQPCGQLPPGLWGLECQRFGERACERYAIPMIPMMVARFILIALPCSPAAARRLHKPISWREKFGARRPADRQRAMMRSRQAMVNSCNRTNRPGSKQHSCGIGSAAIAPSQALLRHLSRDAHARVD